MCRRQFPVAVALRQFPKPSLFQSALDLPTPLSLRTDTVHIELAGALFRYPEWPTPTVIIADGPYSVGGFPGDPPTPRDLAHWYTPHVKAWSRYAAPETSLWFWGTEIGWAMVHPLIAAHGWEYRTLHVWDKGIAHVAGNVNSKTIRRFPIVTELDFPHLIDRIGHGVCGW